MGRDAYRTVAASGESEIRVTGSRFIGWVDAVETVEEAEAVIAEQQANYADSTHVVPAYRIRADPMREYASDDGEPPGSAGDPMLSVLRGEDLENVVAVVIRYYGGTKLGVGGLARAYREALQRALDAAEIVTRVPHVRLSIEVAYEDSGTVRGILEGSSATFEAEYIDRVTFGVRAPRHAANDLRDRIMSATSGRANIVDGR